MTTANAMPVQTQPSAAAPLVGVVVVSYNTRALLRRCLASLGLARLPLRTLVVDNASADGSAEMVAHEFPAVELLACSSNLGFARANNLALQHLLEEQSGAATVAGATPEYILLLNSDAELLPGALETLVSFIQQHARVAVASPRLLYPDGSHQPAAFRFPTLLMSLLDLFPPRGPLLGRLYNSPLNGRYRQDGGRAPFPIDHPLGAAMLVRSAAIRQVGAFDEDYWMYLEEVDWCYRFRQAGWAIWQVPAAAMIHVGGASSSQLRVRSFLALHRSRLHFFRRHYGRTFLRWHRQILRLAALRGLLSGGLALLRASLSGGDEVIRREKERMLAWAELLAMADESQLEA